ncbi:MAG: hypothetical protein ACI9DF_005832 [Verrucomicrobiales bacterium]
MDGDGLTDQGEHDASTDPNAKDTDGDGLEDGPEITTHNTLPLVADTDSDGRSDGDEVAGDVTSDPLVEDTDGDGFRDRFEVAQRSDPSSAASLPANSLGEPDFEWHALEILRTFDAFQGGLDQRDVTFRAHIDFRNAGVSEGEREMIWESGGGTVGFALVYETGNKLAFRAAGNGGNTLTEVIYELTSDQIAAGELPVVYGPSISTMEILLLAKPSHST